MQTHKSAARSTRRVHSQLCRLRLDYHWPRATIRAAGERRRRLQLEYWRDRSECDRLTCSRVNPEEVKVHDGFPAPTREEGQRETSPFLFLMLRSGEHRVAALRRGRRHLILHHIPVFDELSVLHEEDVYHHHRLRPPSGVPPVDHD